MRLLNDEDILSLEDSTLSDIGSDKAVKKDDCISRRTTLLNYISVLQGMRRQFGDDMLSDIPRLLYLICTTVPLKAKKETIDSGVINSI